MSLLHFSEDPTIPVFVPRVMDTRPNEPARVWAVDVEHAPLYYFPRDCPRIAFWALPTSTPEDVARLLGQTAARWVMAIESGWLERLRTTRLYVYQLPSETFTPTPARRFYTSEQMIVPRSVEPVGDLLERLIAAEVELRITPSLWPLYHVVTTSTLDFSIIRMRNARPEQVAG